MEAQRSVKAVGNLGLWPSALSGSDHRIVVQDTRPLALDRFTRTWMTQFLAEPDAFDPSAFALVIRTADFTAGATDYFILVVIWIASAPASRLHLVASDVVILACGTWPIPASVGEPRDIFALLFAICPVSRTGEAVYVVAVTTRPHFAIDGKFFVAYWAVISG